MNIQMIVLIIGLYPLDFAIHSVNLYRLYSLISRSFIFFPRYFFFLPLQQNFCGMQFQSQQLYPQTFTLADSRFQKQSLNTTYINSQSDTQNPSQKWDLSSQPILPQLANHSRSTSPDSSTEQSSIEQYIAELVLRFGKVQKLLVGHCQYECDLHQSSYGFKPMTIDPATLTNDFSNKVTIIEQIGQMVRQLQKSNKSQNIEEKLDNKFQQYYLERHYGGLKIEIDCLSIQDRLQSQHSALERSNISYEQLDQRAYLRNQSNVEEMESDKPDQYSKLCVPMSHIGGYVSLVNQSKISYSQDFCQTSNDYEYECLNVQIPRILEVQIPVVIYKIKEVVISYNESQLISQLNNIDDIINKYSQPYQNIYQGVQSQQKESEETNLETGDNCFKQSKNVQTGNNFKESTANCQTGTNFREKDSQKDIGLQTSDHFMKDHLPKQDSQMPINSNINELGSMMLSSHINDFNRQPKQTEVQLSYSDFPDETTAFKLPLDSYAQLQSLISNEDRNNTDRSYRPPTDRDPPMSAETIVITQKMSGSIIEKYQESERHLREQNIELKQTIQTLQKQVGDLQKKKKDLESHNMKLANRLEEEIEQSSYFEKRLEQLDAELLQQKVQCLTHLGEAKDRKIENLTQQIHNKTAHIDTLVRQIEELTQSLAKAEQVLNQKDEQVQMTTIQLQQCQKQLLELNTCEEDIIIIASTSELNLKKQIQRLQSERTQLRQNLKQYEKRLQSEGLSLQYDEAKEIQGIIQSQEHVYSVQLKEITKKYEQIIHVYQEELDQLKSQIQKLQELRVQMEQEKTQLREDLKQTNLSASRTQQYLSQFEQIIKDYDSQLQQKDEQILKLKEKHKNISIVDGSATQIIERSAKLIDILQKQLLLQRQQKAKMTTRLANIDLLIKKQLQNQQIKKQTEQETKLIEQLTHQLQKKISQIQHLKIKMEEKQSAMIASFNTQSQQLLKELKIQNTRLSKVNSKLKRYTTSLQQQIKGVSCIDGCESHSALLARALQDRNYFMELLTR